MDTTRAPPAIDCVRVLLVGPDPWREQVRPTFARSDAVSIQVAEAADTILEE